MTNAKTGNKKENEAKRSKNLVRKWLKEKTEWQVRKLVIKKKTKQKGQNYHESVWRSKHNDKRENDTCKTPNQHQPKGDVGINVIPRLVSVSLVTPNKNTVPV